MLLPIQIRRTALLLAHIFQTHPFDLSLHVALKHTVISCPFFVSALKSIWPLSICTASSKIFSSRMSHIKTCFLICYLLGKTSRANSVAARRKYVSKLLTSQPERFLSCLPNYLNAHIFNNPISMSEKHLVYFFEVQ